MLGDLQAAEARLSATGAAVLRVVTKSDLLSGGREPPEPSPTQGAHAPRSDSSAVETSTVAPGGTAAIRTALAERVVSLVRTPLAPSQSRCRHHLDACVRDLQQAHRHVLFDDPAELTALALRGALDQLGEMVGAVYTPDLLDRIFSRFCIGK